MLGQVIPDRFQIITSVPFDSASFTKRRRRNGVSEGSRLYRLLSAVPVSLTKSSVGAGLPALEPPSIVSVPHCMRTLCPMRPLRVTVSQVALEDRSSFMNWHSNELPETVHL